MNPVYSEILQVIARWAITSVVSILVTRHVISADQSATLTADLVHKVLVYSPTLIPLAWGIWRVIRQRVKLLTALMPGVHTEDQVNAIVKSGQATPTILTPSSTVPGVPVS